MALFGTVGGYKVFKNQAYWIEIVNQDFILELFYS